MTISQEIKDAIREAVLTDFPHGHFVTAVAECDWETALAHADANNRANFTEIMAWRLQYLPRKKEEKPDFIVCRRCNGRGEVVNPEVDGNGISAEDFYDDPDFADDYRSGVYNISCPHCQGRRVTTESEMKQWEEDEQERRESRLESLREMGIGPGHRDYF